MLYKSIVMPDPKSLDNFYSLLLFHRQGYVFFHTLT